MTPETTPTSHQCATAAELRARLRSACDRTGVPLATRARLVLAATTLARPALAANGHVTVTVVAPAAPTDGATLLHITLALPDALPACQVDALPLPTEQISARGVSWRLPVDAERARASVPDDHAATEAELAAVIVGLDAIEREQRELKHELAETNSGILAMYIQLEERDQQLRSAHRVIFSELEDALRPPPPLVPGVDLAVHYAPAGSPSPTGGDLYDWFLLPDGSLHITVVDAVGHGVTCTRCALYVTHTMRTLALEGHPIEDLVRRTAETLSKIDPDLMATVQVVHYTPTAATLRIANGGHPPALLARTDGTTTYLNALGRGVGFPDPGSDEIVTTHFTEGDLLILYTDGLTESRRRPEEDEPRLARLAGRIHSEPVHSLPRTIAETMLDRTVHQDDTLVLAIRPTA